MSSHKSQNSTKEVENALKPRAEAKGASAQELLGGFSPLILIVISAEILIGGIMSKSIDWVSAGRDFGIAHFALFWLAVATLAKAVLTILPLQRKADWEYQAYAVGLIHNCFCVYYGLFEIDWVGRVPSGFNDPTTEAHRHMFRVVAGFFAFDAAYLFVVEIIFQRKPFFKSSWMYFTLHHPVSVICFWYMTTLQNCGFMICFLMPFLEWSGVPLNITWIFRYHGINKTHPALDVSLKAIGALLFTIGRMGVLNYVFYHFCLSEHVGFVWKVFGSMIPLLSLYWEYKLVLFVMKAASPKTAKVLPSKKEE